ncbi:MAG: penicillin-binding transpeptidase domain-containing protein [Ilumatobacteraceae bacterium]
MVKPNRPKRLVALGVVSVVLMSSLAARMWVLQAVEARTTESIVLAVRTRTIKLLPERGRIFDVTGRVAADNKRILTVTIDRNVIKNASDRLAMFQRLSGPLGMPLELLYKRYEDKRSGPLEALPLKEDVSEEAAQFVQERTEDYPGVYVREEWRRNYPYGALASHIIGYMGAILSGNLAYYRSIGYDPNERVGSYGVEQSYETVLRGKPGYVRYEVDAQGNVLRILERVEPVVGNDLQLSIDLSIQQFAEQALETEISLRRRVEAGSVNLPDGTPDPQYLEVNYYKSPAGSVVLLNHDNGQVVAMASYPRFDNRWFGSGISRNKFAQIFPQSDDPDLSILVNRAISGRYNLGSSFKPFVAYAALNTGQLPGGPEYTFEDRGTYKLESIPNDRCQQGVKCVFRNATCRATGAPCRYGNVTVEEALAVSSDSFFYKIGEQILTERGYQPILEQQVRLFGFGSPTNIDLPYEYSGTIPSKALKRRMADLGAISEESGKAYYVGDQILFAIGQGLLSATPLQVANAYGVIANSGKLFQPHVVQAILSPGTPDQTPGVANLGYASIIERFDQSDPVRTIDMSGDRREPIVKGLTRVITGPGVTFGYYHKTTGENLFRGYPYKILPIAGKTGTAQGFGNLPWNDSSAFAAFSRDPAMPFSAYAYLEKAGYGSQAAAPVVKCIFTALAGEYRLDPVVPADPLNINSGVAAPPSSLRNPLCLAGVSSESRD